MTREFYNRKHLYKQQHHVSSLLIILCVIQIHSAACNLCSQVNFHHILGTRLNMPLSHFGQQAIIASVNFTQLQHVVPLSSTSKSLPIHSNLTFHICYIIFLEKVLGTFKEMGRIKYSSNFSILKPEERCLVRNTQQFIHSFICVLLIHTRSANQSDIELVII